MRPWGMKFLYDNEDWLETKSNLDPPDSASLCFWMGVENFDTWIMGNDFYSWDVGTNSSNKLVNALNHSWTGALASTAALNSNQLYHIVCTAGSDTTAQIYIDGAFDSETDGHFLTPGASHFQIGNVADDTPYQFGGYLQDVRIYNRVLTANEVQTIYASQGNDSIVSGLTNRWLLNDGVEYSSTADSTVQDYGPDQNHMIVKSGEPFYMGTELKIGRKYHK